MFAPPISPARPRGSPGSPELRDGGAEDRRLPAAPPRNSGRAAGRSQGGSLLKTGGPGTAGQRSSKGQRLGSRPPRRTAAPTAGGSARSSLGSVPGPARGVWGRGRARPPLPRRAPGDLLIKTATPSRRRPASYLCATAAADPAAPAAPKYCRNDGSPAALKIPDKESRNSRFPTSQSLVPAPAPLPAAAVSAASDSALRPRETGPRGRLETAHALPGLRRSPRAYPSPSRARPARCGAERLARLAQSRAGAERGPAHWSALQLRAAGRAHSRASEYKRQTARGARVRESLWALAGGEVVWRRRFPETRWQRVTALGSPLRG